MALPDLTQEELDNHPTTCKFDVILEGRFILCKHPGVKGDVYHVCSGNTVCGFEGSERYCENCKVPVPKGVQLVRGLIKFNNGIK